jgi:hypothetical protein
MHLFKQGVKFVSAPGGFILDIVNREKMQHVMLKKMDRKNANKKATAEKTYPKKKNINAQKMPVQKHNAKQI